VWRPIETKPAKITDTAKIAVSTAMSNRRESRTSASAPAGKVKRNKGGLTATCTRETINGFGSMLVINQPDAVSNIAVPTSETTLTLHMTVKAKWLNGPQRDGAASLRVEAIVTERARFLANRARVCEKRQDFGRHP
jgi:hypothetical protein